MLEIIKETSQILKDLPDLAIWILAGVFLYKTIIVGSIFGVFKLLILKTHDILSTPKEKIVKYELSDYVYVTGGSLKRFEEFLQSLVHQNNDYRLNSDKINFIKEAYYEKLNRTKKDYTVTTDVYQKK